MSGRDSRSGPPRMFQMLGVFAEFERGIIRERVNAGLARAREKGTALGRPRTAPAIEKRLRGLCRAWAFSRSVARRASAPASCNASFRQCRASAAPQLTHAFELIALLVRLL